MADLLLPGSEKYENILHLTEMMTDGNSLSDDALYTIKAFWQALRVLHAAEAEGPYRSWMVWESEELRPIREAIEEEESDDISHTG